MYSALYFNALKATRKVYSTLRPNNSNFGRNWKMFHLKEYASNVITEALNSDKPFMAARLGATEISCMVNYLGVKHFKKYKSIANYIQTKTPPWWWETHIFNQMKMWSGFFPLEVKMVEKFCELMINDLKYVDLFGSWLKEEVFFEEYLKDSKKVVLEDLEPFFTKKPWTWALEGKKVLVVHPFAKTIQKQYLKRNLLFENNLLPEFDLITIKAVQSIAGEKTKFKDWFEALEWMKKQIDLADYDVAIIGCGAYGLPLAAYIKRSGKKAIQLAGATQLLFGIKGKRWEEFIVWPYTNLFNGQWVRPSEEEKPKNAVVVENGCYW